MGAAHPTFLGAVSQTIKLLEGVVGYLLRVMVPIHYFQSVALIKTSLSVDSKMVVEECIFLALQPLYFSPHSSQIT